MAEFWEYAALSSHAYSSSSGDDPDKGYFVPEGFSGGQIVTKDNGLFARVYTEAGTGKKIIAVRGTEMTDTGDLFADATLALGIDLPTGEPTQVSDLADFVVDQILAHGKENVEITGHSLGGGLAALMSAIFDIKAYGFNPAPFANYLAGSDLEILALGRVVNRIKAFYPDEFSQGVVDIAGAFGNWMFENRPPTPEEANFLYRLNTNFEVAQMRGDLIAGINGILGSITSPFPNSEQTNYQVANTLYGTFNLDFLDLHSIDLLTLAIKTSSLSRNGAGGEWSERPFDGGGPGDGLIRGNADIARIILGDKVSLPSEENGDWTALLRWWANDLELYSRNWDALEELMQKGVAAEGFSETSVTEGSLHGALLDLGFSTIRDGIDDGSIEQQARDAFRLEDHLDRVHFDMREIDVENGPAGQITENGRHSATAAIDDFVWEKIERSFNGTIDNRTREVVEELFSTTRQEVKEGRVSLNNAQVFTVQAGAETGGFTYRLTPDDSKYSVSNTMIGGDGVNELEGGAGNDILIGGRASDIFHLSPGEDIFVGGGGDDQYFANTELNGFYHIFGSQGGKDALIFGDYFKDQEFTLTFENITDNAFDGLTIDAQDVGQFTLYDISEVILTDGQDTVIRKDNSTLNTRISYGEGDVELRRIVSQDEPGEENDEEQPPLIIHNFDVADATKKLDLSASTSEGFEEGERSNDIITLNGTEQLIGGVSFDFEQFDYTYRDGTQRYYPFPLTNGFDPVLEEVSVYSNALSVFAAWTDWGKVISTGFATYGIAARNPSMAGIGAAMQLSFVAVGIAEYGRMVLSYKHALDRRYFGIHGEEYKLGRMNDDGTQTLTILVDPDDTQVPQEIVIENWKEGDFGIKIDIAARGQGADSPEGTWRTGSLTADEDLGLTDSYIRGIAANKGFEIPPPITPPGDAAPLANAAPLEGDFGIVRIGNAADNALGGTTGNDVFDGGDGNDTLYGGEGYDVYVFEAGDGHDVIFDASPEGSLIRFRDGVELSDITIEDVPGDDGAMDRLITYAQGDTIRIKNWSELSAETQAAWGFEELAPDVVQPTDVNDVPDRSSQTVVTEGTDQDDVLAGNDTGELFNGYGGNDMIDGAGGADQIIGGDGDDMLFGGAGRDRILAADGNDTLVGGTGRDFLDGGAGDDFYYFELGDGTDTIVDAESGSRPTLIFFGSLPDEDRLSFGLGINPADILITRNANNTDLMTLTIGATGEAIKLADQYKNETDYGSNGIEFVDFADGTTWSRQDMQAIYLAQNVTDGDDAILGTLTPETLNGGSGDDHLLGGGGADTYVWERGGGNDRITDLPPTFFVNSANRLLLGEGIDASDVTVDRGRDAGSSNDQNYDLILKIGGPDGGEITVDRFFASFGDDPAGNGIEVIVFADGTVWDRDEIYNRYIAGLSSSGNNSIEGTPGSEVIDGGAGFDRISGAEGNDLLLGGSGDDRLGSTFQEDGDDTLIGGLGNDNIQGGRGSDTFIYGAGFGDDTLQDGRNGADVNRVVFTDHLFEDMTFLASGDEGLDLRIVTDDGNSLFIDGFEGRSFISGSGGWYENRWQNIMEFEFSDGQVVNATQIVQIANVAGDLADLVEGGNGADALDGSEGRDRIAGLGGNDTLSGEAGADYLAGGAGDDDVSAGAGDDLLLGGTGADTLRADAGDDVVFGGDGSDLIEGGGDDDYLAGGGGNDTLDGGEGDDEIEAGAGNDTLRGGTGNDELIGDTGSDTYFFNFGDGQDTIAAGQNRASGDVETLILGPGLTQAMMRPLFDGDDLVLTFANGTADQITLRDFLGNGELSELRFDSGESITGQELLEAITGATAGDDVPTGSAEGENGLRVQYGGRGDDFLANIGADTTYVFGKGDGQDRMYAREGSLIGPQYTHKLVIRGYTEDEIILTRGGPENDDLIVSFTSGPDTMTVINHFGFAGIYADDEVDFIQFGDGTRWNEKRIAVETLRDTGVGSLLDETLTSTAEDETLAGGGGSDSYLWSPGGGSDQIADSDTGADAVDKLVFGIGVAPQNVGVSRTGNDILLAVEGETITLTDQLAGDGRGVEQIVFKSGDVWTRGTIVSKLSEALTTQGDDVISGGDGDETLSGGQGDDTVEGGAGSDDYTYALGDGSDVVREADTGGTDRLHLDASVDQAATRLQRDAQNPDDLLILLEDGEMIRVEDQFADGGLEQIRFADGTYLNRTSIETRAVLDSVTDGDDMIVGTGAVDALRGGIGDDTLDGGNGADYYAYGVGDGQDVIADTGGGGDFLLFGRDIELSDVTAARDGNDLVISFAGTPGDGLRITDHFAGSALAVLQFVDGTILDQAALDQLATTGVLPSELPEPLAPLDFEGLEPQLAEEDVPFSYDIPAGTFANNTAVSATQADGSALPDWLSFAGQTLSGTPNEEDAGALELIFEGTGTDGEPLTQTLIIGVLPVNDAPIAGGAIGDAEVREYEDIQLDLSTADITDSDDPLLFYSLQMADGSELPSWISFDPETLELTASPRNNAAERASGFTDYGLQLVAEDGVGLQAVVDFNIRALPEEDEFEVNGTPGNDVLTGGSYRDDVLTGGLGDDVLRGQGGRDVYVFNAGDGADTIDADYGSRDATSGVIRFGMGITEDDVILTRSGYTDSFAYDYWYPDLTITFVGAPGDSITIAEQYHGLDNDLSAITRIEFSDGTVWDEARILAEAGNATGEILGNRQNNLLVGTDGDDTMIAMGGQDTLDGGAGDDLMSGGANADTYLWGFGSGHDIIRDQIRDSGSRIISIDTLKFGPGITADDLVFTLPDSRLNSITATDRGALVIGLEGSPDDSLKIDNQYKFQIGRSFGIDIFEFDDGSQLSLEELDFLVNPDGLLTGTSGVDQMVGTTRGETLESGLGDDLMQGGPGNDIYVWNLGDGNDVIYESDDRSFDVLQFGEGISPDDILLTRPRRIGNELSDMFIEILPSGEILHIDDQYQVSFEEFAEGSNDERLVLVPIIDEIRFADGTVWNYAYLRDYFLTGTDGNDSVIGYEFREDTINGGAGDDTLDGMGGDDVYIWGAGFGNDQIVENGPINIFENDLNIIRFVGDLTPDDLVVTREIGEGHAGALEVHHRFTIAATGESLLLAAPYKTSSSTYQIQFENAGILWGIADVNAAVLSGVGTEGDDTYIALGSIETVALGAGDDRVVLSDFLSVDGGTGSDTYEQGRFPEENVTITEGTGDPGDVDVLIAPELRNPDQIVVQTSPNERDLLISWSSFDDPIILVDMALGEPGVGIEQIQYADGTIQTANWLRSVASPAQITPLNGTSADETLTSTPGEETLFDARGGDDRLEGSTSATDIYLWSPGDGNDVIDDARGGNYFDTPDMLVLEGVTQAQVQLRGKGADLEITYLATGEVITIEDQFSASSTNGAAAGIEQIIFADGRLNNRAEIIATSRVEGTQAGETLNGSSYNDVFVGLGGNDVIYSGGSGTDVFGQGSDTYLWSKGDGNDTIVDRDRVASTGFGSSATPIPTTDVLVLEDVTRDEVDLSRFGSFDLIIRILTTGEQIRIVDQYSSSYSGTAGLERLLFSDGEKLEGQAAFDAVGQYRGTTGNNSIYATSDDDVIIGEAGNDSLFGRSGNDIYVFGAGDGLDRIREETYHFGKDVIQFEAGITPGDVTLSRTGDEGDLLVTYGDGDVITVQFHFASRDGAIAEIIFDDGTIWDQQRILDEINAPDASDQTITGSAGGDVLGGGGGTDLLRGLKGEDTYTYDLGDGAVTITDGGDDVFETDLLRLGSGIVPQDVEVTREGDSIVLSFPDGGRVVLTDRLSDVLGSADAVVFDDGTYWDFFILLEKSDPNADNLAPITVSDTFTTQTGEALTLSPSDLLDNDSDPDGDMLTLELVNSLDGGTAEIVEGEILFTPTQGFVGTAQFLYVVNDGAGGKTAGTAIVIVGEAQNTAPVARNDMATIVTNTSILQDVLANDSDIDGDTLTLSDVSGAVNGTAEIEAGQLRYTPNAGFEGEDVLTYTISDGNGGTATATLTITVAPMDVTGTLAADTLSASGLKEQFTLLAGDDTLEGSLAEFDGDRVLDFGSGDMIKFEGAQLSSDQIALAAGNEAQLTISYGSGQSSTLTLNGDFTEQSFEILTYGGDTYVSLAGAGVTHLSPGGERFVTTDNGPNKVFGDSADDVIVTSGGADYLAGGSGFDVLLGGGGGDILVGGLGGDNLTGGSDGDIFSFDASHYVNGTLSADFITDFEIGVDTIELSGFGFTGLSDLNFVSLAVGDAINLGNGSFVVLEGISNGDLSESDFAMSDFARDMSVVSPASIHRLSDASDRFATSDTGANHVFAGAGNDAVIGGAGDDVLRGEADNDVLIGGAGNDRLIGGQGAERLTGREGADRFEFTAGEETSFVADFITDYEAADTVVLQGFGFTSVDDLAFGTVGTGDVSLQLAATHFIVFEGITNKDDLADGFELL